MDKILFMTVGTGVGDSDKKVESLAHGLLFSIEKINPKHIVFFGSELSKKTIESLKNQYKNKKKEKLENYDFILLNNIDDFDYCFEKIEEQISRFESSEINIDYTSGTKTMTMTAAICSVLYRKELILISGKRGNNGIVIKGTEKFQTQNLYKAHDNLTLDKVKNLFNNNRFESAKELLGDITYLNEYEDYLNLINSYCAWDKFNHEKANKFLKSAEFSNKFNDLKPNNTGPNKKVLNIITNKDHEKRYYYILADLLNNARRRGKEGKYDDAVARIYRSLELIGQIELKNKYNIKTSDVNIKTIEKLVNDKGYINSLKSRQDFFDGKIKIGLSENFKLLEKLNNQLGHEFKSNKKKYSNNLKFRNMSILAHGCQTVTKEEYEKFENLVYDLSLKLEPEISDFMLEAEFPKFTAL